MPFSPPEGFAAYPGSHLYYRSALGIDPQSGEQVQWVTYFDPNTGEYHQVSYPLPQQSSAQPSSEEKADETPISANTNATVVGSAQAVKPAITVEQKPARKSKKGLIVTIVLFVCLAALAFCIWFFKWYTYLPIFSEKNGASEGDSNSSLFSDMFSQGERKEEDSVPDDPAEATELALEFLQGYSPDQLTSDVYSDEQIKKLYDYYTEQWELDAYTSQLRSSMEGYGFALNEESGEKLTELLQDWITNPEISAEKVSADGENAAVEVISFNRVSLEKMNDWLTGLDMYSEMETYLKDQGMSMSDLGSYSDDELNAFATDLVISLMERDWISEFVEIDTVETNVDLTYDEQLGWIVSDSEPLETCLIDGDAETFGSTDSTYTSGTEDSAASASSDASDAALSSGTDTTGDSQYTAVSGTYICYEDPYGYVYSEEYQPYLTLDSYGDFSMSINAGEGMVLLSGYYDTDGQYVTLYVQYRDGYGFLGDDVDTVAFTIRDTGVLRLDVPDQLGIVYASSVFIRE